MTVLTTTGYGKGVTADRRPAIDTVVLDIDGTLIDSVYAHVWSWREAFRVLGVDVPAWQVHRAIGMGGDRLVGEVTSEAVDAAVGDQVRAVQSDLYRELSAHLTPTPGATALLEELKIRGLQVVLASSGSRDDAEQAVATLEARRWIDGAITGDDTTATKPDTEPVQRAVDSVHGDRALVVGDATWDMESARRAGHAAVGLLTGGIAESELRSAGAAQVYRDPAALTTALDEVLTQGR
jgi:phosphoglycolate phosphatase-like HAD superfamily hydrolase